MPLYIYTERKQPHKTRITPFPHYMFCDPGVEEMENLHALAFSVGMWGFAFQARPALPGYSVRYDAYNNVIDSGALLCDRATLGQVMRRWKAWRAGDPFSGLPHPLKRRLWERKEFNGKASTPVEERSLYIAGALSAGAKRICKYNLPLKLPESSGYYFLEYAYRDIPMGTRFDVIYPRGHPELGIHTEGRVIASTQQFSWTDYEIPRGWKTIAVLHFPHGVPDLVRELPTESGWTYNKNAACLCTLADWLAVYPMDDPRLDIW